jgi:hypothetical protein
LADPVNLLRWCIVELNVTADSVQQPLTINSTVSGGTFYASFINVRPTSLSTTWNGSTIHITSADTKYIVGIMYISYLNPRAVTTTILASTPQQGGVSMFGSSP